VPIASRRQNSQTISWFHDLYRRTLLNLDPPYQRRSVWNQAYKDDFIDTVLQQYPAPAIFVYEEVTADGVSKYQVVDGKQRLTTVFDFSVGSFPVSESSPLTHLQGKYFSRLSAEEKTAFWTYQFPVEYLPTNDETLINEIFTRINKNTAKLTRQELRHARFSGSFITAAEELSDELFKALPEGFPRIESQSRKQMKDVELVANLLLALEEEAGEEHIRGYSQDELDKAFSDRDLTWEKGASVRKRFGDTVGFLRRMVAKPEGSPLYKTRLRNQADFYSLFMAVSDLLTNQEWSDEHGAARLADFIAVVEDEQRRPEDRAAGDYFKATRSNSNDSGPRKLRHKIMTAVLGGSARDYSSTDSEQIPVGRELFPTAPEARS
jgi:hypothetical protein